LGCIDLMMHAVRGDGDAHLRGPLFHYLLHSDDSSQLGSVVKLFFGHSEVRGFDYRLLRKDGRPKVIVFGCVVL
jgi:hypothetical protein